MEALCLTPHALLPGWPGLSEGSAKCPWTEREVSRKKQGQMEREPWGLIQLGSVLTPRPPDSSPMKN